jgi:CBS domain-containing protein
MPILAGDVMTKTLVTVAPDQPVAAVAKTLAARGIHRVLVVEGGRLCGVVSSLDVVRLVGEGRLVEAGPPARRLSGAAVPDRPTPEGQPSSGAPRHPT